MKGKSLSSASIKLGLLFAAVLFVLGVLLYAQFIVHKLQDRERTMAELLASAIANTASAPGGVHIFARTCFHCRRFSYDYLRCEEQTCVTIAR